MIRMVDDGYGYVVGCDVCGGLMGDYGRTDGDGAVFCDKGNADVFIREYGLNRIGDYTVCHDCNEKIKRGEVEVSFVKNEGAKK